MESLLCTGCNIDIPRAGFYYQADQKRAFEEAVATIQPPSAFRALTVTFQFPLVKSLFEALKEEEE